jgi:hypothetical protein
MLRIELPEHLDRMAGTMRQWSLTSFGSLTASAPSMLRGKVYRTAGGTGGDVFVTRVLIYGVGLR